jgi:TRAP-type C4-dicarboxylate transport system permease small subunit
MQTFIDRLCRGLEYLIAAALAAMVVLVFGNVVMRYLFNSGIMVSEELSRWLFLWGTFLGAVVALHDRAHLGVDLVLDKLPAGARRACLVLAHVLMLAIVVMLFRGAWEQVKINWDVTAPTTGWSMAIVHASAAVFAVLAALILSNDLVRMLRGREVPGAAPHGPDAAGAQDFINKTA